MLSAKDLSFMRVTQTDHMPDTGRVLVYTAGVVNEYNEQDAPTYPPQSPIICGLDVGSGSERKANTMTTITYDAVLRVPLSAGITEKDRFEIVTRFGESVDPIVYEIVSPPRRGPSAIRLLLRKVLV